MKQTRSFPERLEALLIAGMLVGILLVAQRFSVTVFRAGLVLLVASTLLQIAIGNVPKHLGFAATTIRVILIVALIAILFCLGIVLVPYFAQLGR